MIVPPPSDDPEDVAWRRMRSNEVEAESELVGYYYAGGDE